MNVSGASTQKTREEIAPVQASVWGEAVEGFASRHLGTGAEGVALLLKEVGVSSMEELLAQTLPPGICSGRALDLPAPLGEAEALVQLRAIAERNSPRKSLIGQGYHGTFTPPVIQRNILENPAWYTAYTPYQAEIAQGRLEALAIFQTLVCELTGLEIANASLLDEPTAAAEAVSMAHALWKQPHEPCVFVDASCHPQTLAVLRTRTEPVGVLLHVGNALQAEFSPGTFAVLVQLPDTRGRVRDFAEMARRAHAAGATVIVAADPLALTLLEAPGKWGADIVVGSMQRFGVPMGYGGPHAAYLATREKLKRVMPGRLVGLSHDVQGRPAYRLSLQTREQHIRRDKATSNICTAQVLLAVLSAMYAVYHGPEGLQAIALRVHGLARVLARGLEQLGLPVEPGAYFDSLSVRMDAPLRDTWIARACERGVNLRRLEDGVGIALDETVSLAEVATVLNSALEGRCVEMDLLAAEVLPQKPLISGRCEPFLQHPVFHRHRSETEMLRFIRALESKDLSLVHSMIPLGSCTMKLNATSEMLPVSWPGFCGLHPFCPEDQALGYRQILSELEAWLAEITGFAAVSLEPNAGSQGEYAGLLAIRAYHRSRGEAHRDVCLIPVSAHGTNPASAVMAGMRVVPVACRPDGDVDLRDLHEQAQAHSGRLAALMVTYPSTHGVFEEGILEMCALMHKHGAQVYMDGANMNAQVGLCRPAELGADVCHLNLHKTFCIPHGGGGPGVGPIGVAPHLAPFLPGTLCQAHPGGVGPVSAVAQGSAGIFVIPWMYIRMMGAAGLRAATQLAILNANYIASRLDAYFPVLFKGTGGRVAHECILDLRAFKNVTAEDVAKRLMDYGFHSPTLSWPVPGTLMVEPTESEAPAELDRFCEAMIAIHAEMLAVEEGRADPVDNVLKNAPHTAESVCADIWSHPYSREQAAYPLPWLRTRKFWPPVSRIDNVWGDRNLFCSCAPVESR